MLGIDIQYEFDGDEAAWEAAVSTFVAAVDADAEIAGKFRYRVMKAREGNRRIHWGSWDVPETVQTLQSRDYFKTFAAELQRLAAGTLTTTPVAEWTATAR